MIFAGVYLLEKFEFITYIFGLIFTLDCLENMEGLTNE